ncbi:mammalian cell entry protein [Mycolicibacterium parafortuitum]|uniref:Mammalian cell entry protein n=1 Tax=Mycolicibacterium parafortuitum TaxID=39692 RepID=A0A7I7U5Y5_MYCPF|nr:MCE family protein [Mycolicibacterium parafortuitum]PQD98448.1 mammalian cell entry protein [Mycobacterium sp. EPG1]BBY76784.1 mammalian cell entry protein [Mycolicibacterium parafortuitum]
MRRSSIKFLAFAAVMSVLTAFLVMMFADYRGGATNSYSAVFHDVARLKPGDSVRIAGVRVGTVDDVRLRPDKSAVVSFDADRKVVLTVGTRAEVRYLNLVGDRYLELVDSPGSTRTLPDGGQIPAERTAPALDLDLLLGGLRPLTQGLDAEDINVLTSSLLQALQGQGGVMESLLSKTSTFTATLADHSDVIQEVIGNLRDLTAVLAKDSRQFSDTIERLDSLVTGLAADRDPIGASIESLEKGTASLTDLLDNGRPPLAATIDQLNRLSVPLDADKDKIDIALQKAPGNFKKLVRLGAYGSWINYYLCGITLRVSDLEGQTAVFPWVKNQGAGRCADP